MEVLDELSPISMDEEWEEEEASYISNPKSMNFPSDFSAADPHTSQPVHSPPPPPPPSSSTTNDLHTSMYLERRSGMDDVAAEIDGNRGIRNDDNNRVVDDEEEVKSNNLFSSSDDIPFPNSSIHSRGGGGWGGRLIAEALSPSSSISSFSSSPEITDSIPPSASSLPSSSSSLLPPSHFSEVIESSSFSSPSSSLHSSSQFTFQPPDSNPTQQKRTITTTTVDVISSQTSLPSYPTTTPTPSTSVSLPPHSSIAAAAATSSFSSSSPLPADSYLGFSALTREYLRGNSEYLRQSGDGVESLLFPEVCLRENLRLLLTTQDSIEAAFAYVASYLNPPGPLCQILAEEFCRSDAPDANRLAIFYLFNHLVQNIHSQLNFAESALHRFLYSVAPVVSSSQEDLKNKCLRCVSLWQLRAIYSQQICEKLRYILNRPSYSMSLPPPSSSASSIPGSLGGGIVDGGGGGGDCSIIIPSSFSSSSSSTTPFSSYSSSSSFSSAAAAAAAGHAGKGLEISSSSSSSYFNRIKYRSSSLPQEEISELGVALVSLKPLRALLHMPSSGKAYHLAMRGNITEKLRGEFSVNCLEGVSLKELQKAKRRYVRSATLTQQELVLLQSYALDVAALMRENHQYFENLRKTMNELS